MKINFWKIALVCLTISLLWGCTSSVNLVDLSKYQDTSIKVKTRDGACYTLGEGWKVDSLHNIVGRGSRIFQDSTSRFYGQIESTTIEKTTVNNDSLIGLIAFTAIILTFIYNN
jgi:hypothetical protein